MDALSNNMYFFFEQEIYDTEYSLGFGNNILYLFKEISDISLAKKMEAPESSNGHLVALIVILIVIVIALLGVLFYSKRQQQDVYDGWEDEEEML